MNMAKTIRKICIDKDISLSMLADRTGQSLPNLSNKIAKDNFTVQQLEAIAAALDCSLKIDFIDNAPSKDDNEI